VSTDPDIRGRDVAAQLAHALVAIARWLSRLVRGEVVKRVGGPARARVVALFGAVLALNGAAMATVGAVAPQLEASLHINDTQIGLLSSVSLLVGAVFTIPVGFLVDRFRRLPMLSISIVLWSLTSLAGAFAHNYSGLLTSRLLLGAVVATGGPAIASLTGDYFPASERGRVYAYILGGEIAGTAVGFIFCGSIASLISWQAAFVLLSIPGFFLARELHRTVPEPLRGGQSRLEWGVLDLHEAAAAAASRAEAQGLEDDDPPQRADELAVEAATKLGAVPDPKLVLEQDPKTLGLVESVKYILSIPTNWLMIISSSLGYFFFSGLSTFALLFVRGHYHASQATSELVLAMLVGGALVGTLISGRITDMMLHRGNLQVRVWVPAICYFAAAVCLIPGFLSTHLTPGLWFDVIGAALLSAANPPLDAARLDIMPAGLWGRAESTRTVIRSLAQALAPILFGGLADLIAGIEPSQAPIGTHVHGHVSHNTANGLEISFLLLLVTVGFAGYFLLRARTTYPTDVATAAASNQGGGPTRPPSQPPSRSSPPASPAPPAPPPVRPSRTRRRAITPEPDPPEPVSDSQPTEQLGFDLDDTGGGPGRLDPG
jgi:MFS family permease